jgi:valyl-tRNA synthetase
LIVEQQRRLGESCDWSRQRFTMDEGLSEAVLKVFVDLYREGLIYKDKRLVNWDPVFQTAISDLEVEQKEVNGHMWQFAYPLIEGPVDGIAEIIIATTRPETMLGDGAVAVHPSDERYKNLIGKLVRLPIAERHIPIIADEYPDPEFGSGAVKITGAHDFNDFEVARRNDIPLIPLMDTQARMIVTPENNVPEHYEGIDRYEARKLVLKEIEELGFYRGVEEKLIAQPFGDRSGVVIEPMLTDQWYVDAETLAKPAIQAVESGQTEFVPKNWEKTYFEWMRNIQPWCISRQLWWGHQIPAWYGPDGEIFVAHDEDEARVLAGKHYGEDKPLTRDPDVLDTWFSSALWPFSTLGWPEQTPELERYYKTDVLVTGFDIIFFWVARMMMMGLHFMKDEKGQPEVPFHTIYIHALVRDEQGQKMSKSKGNVMDPLEMIDELGADALRFTLAAMAAQGRDIKLAKSRVEGYRNFGTKIWNASRFLEMNECVRVENFDPGSLKQGVNKWIVGEVEKATGAVTAGIEAYRFNEAAGAIYRFVWNIFCDWYLELIKPALQGDDEDAKAETRATAAWALDQSLILLHPFMPFITEELWTRLGERGPARDTMLILAGWPELKGLVVPEAEAEFDWVIRVVSEIRSIRAEMNVPAGAKVPVTVLGAGEAMLARLKANRDPLTTLARLGAISTSDTAPKGSVQFVLDEATFALPLEDVIDISAETGRLNGEIEKIGKDISQIDAKLANENFTSRAPEHVVEEQRQRKADAEAVVAKLNDALKRLEAAG